MSPFFKGFLISLSLITAIGAQNTFIIKNGILHRHIFLIALICVVLDGILISLGVLGMGVLVERSPYILTFLQYAGFFFLMGYGCLALRHSCSSPGIELNSDNNAPSMKSIIFTLLGVSLLNPHAYLDAVVLIGGVGADYPSSQKLIFLVGCVAASTLWFFSLSYASKSFSHVLRRPLPWRILNLMIALIMFTIGISLFRTSLI